MEENPKMKWWQEQAVDVFKQSFFSELYSFHLFVTESLISKEFYWFEQDEKGDAVWLLQRDSQKQEYKPLRVEEAKKLSIGQRVVPSVCQFWHSAYIARTWLAAMNTSIKDIEKRLVEGGQTFAQRINQAFVDVLMASVDNKVPVQAMRLGDILAQVSDRLQREDSADRLLFPKDFLHRLIQQDLIIPDNEIPNNHYVGKTKTGLYAFWASELPGDTALILASTAGVTITLEPRFDFAARDLSIGVGGVVYLNPIVKDTRSVIALEGIGQVIELTTSQMTSVPAVPGGEPAIINEIRSALNKLRFLKATKTLLLADFEEVARTYQSEAYKACVVMCGAVMEGLLLGNLERAKSIKLLQGAGRLTNLTVKEIRRKLQEASLEDLINHTRGSNCIDGFTDEVARMVQRCRNSVHPGRVLRGDEVLDAFDKKAADLALSFLNVLCSHIAKS